MPRLWTLLLLATLGGNDGPARPRVQDASDAFFALEVVPEFCVQVAPADERRLQAEPREYVKATLCEGRDAAVVDVAVKLKGAAGSFRPWEERPALTVNIRKYRRDNRFTTSASFI